MASRHAGIPGGKAFRSQLNVLDSRSSADSSPHLIPFSPQYAYLSILRVSPRSVQRALDDRSNLGQGRGKIFDRVINVEKDKLA